MEAWKGPSISPRITGRLWIWTQGTSFVKVRLRPGIFMKKCSLPTIDSKDTYSGKMKVIQWATFSTYVVITTKFVSKILHSLECIPNGDLGYRQHETKVSQKSTRKSVQLEGKNTCMALIEWRVAGVLRSRVLVETLKVPLKGRKKDTRSVSKSCTSAVFSEHPLWIGPYWEC